MYKYLGIFLLLLACQENPQPAVAATTSDTLTLSSTTYAPLQQLPANFLENLDIDSWQDLADLQKGVENLATLNIESISVYLINLRGHTQKMGQNPFPDPFNIPPIRSRLKVLQMQAAKCLYFTRHYKEDSLQPALGQLFEHYNSFLNRIISVREETEAMPEAPAKEKQPS